MKKIAMNFDKNTNIEAIKLAREKPSKDFPQANISKWRWIFATNLL